MKKEGDQTRGQVKNRKKVLPLMLVWLLNPGYVSSRKFQLLEKMCYFPVGCKGKLSLLVT